MGNSPENNMADLGYERKNHGIKRRGFLRCMAWAGTGTIWTANAGYLSSELFGQAAQHRVRTGAGFSFVQISDSHIGFSGEANRDVTSTFREAINKINALDQTPDFLIHTGDLSHFSKSSEFDTVDQLLKGAKPGQTFFVPGERDVLADNGRQYLERYGQGTRGAGWFSFDHKGVHFVGLINVANLKTQGLGTLGGEQLAWLKKDLAGRSSSTPIVVFAHIPLWRASPEGTWGTSDGMIALSYLKAFGSVTVLNGHVHQVMQKLEGTLFLHTAMSTAFPQLDPGTVGGSRLTKVPPEHLRELLGITHISYVAGMNSLVVVDSRLAMTSPIIAKPGN